MIDSEIKKLIRLRVLEMLFQPVRADLLFARISTEYLSATKEDYHKVVEGMLALNEIIELKYTIGETKNSILFPINTDLHLNINQQYFWWKQVAK